MLMCPVVKVKNVKFKDVINISLSSDCGTLYPICDLRGWGWRGGGTLKFPFFGSKL